MFRLVGFSLPGLGSAILLLFGLGLPSMACQICLPMPTESLADRVLAAEHLVLARENPEKPFTLRTIRPLQEGITAAPPLDLFLDSSSRRQLSLNEDLSFLCGWSAETGEWQRLVLHDAVTAPVIEAMLAHRESWHADPSGRVRYFADYLGHENTTLADLAHIEVARAPYGQLLEFADRLPREELHGRLKDLRRMEWHALYILFLARGGNESDKQRIRDEIAGCAEFGLVTQTAAWATALIEIDGRAGIDRLAELYLGSSNRSPKEITALHAALKVHGDKGPSEPREAVISAYGTLLQKYPAIAADLADDLTRWERFDHTEMLSALLRQESFDLVATSRIRNHLRLAQAASGPTELASVDTATSRNQSGIALIGGLLLISLILALCARPKAATIS